MTTPDRPTPPLRAVRIETKCPVCNKLADTKYRPFCTKRCADIDLGRWLKESYRVPTAETPDDEEEMPPGPTGQAR
ncbi:MAG: DNA gyrase inhibitor YacG [Reyranellales bacterium]